MSAPRVVIVHLGRAGSMGAGPRLATLRAIFEGAGAEVSDVKLRVDHRPRASDLLHTDPRPVLRGDASIEALSWSLRSADGALRQARPDLVVCLTARAYHPTFAAHAPVVVDFVDRLSVSYRDRAAILGRRPRSAGFRVLAGLAARVEDRARPDGVTAIAAGWNDARDLDATWIPNVCELAPLPDAGRIEHDAIFFGNLAYPPNLEAVDVLMRTWPVVQARRPGTTLLLAGANPSEAMRSDAARLGWTLHADFASVADELATARISLAPLVHASGIQNKVLEAAAHGRPQVLTPAALAGLAPGFPAQVAPSEHELADAITTLLDDPGHQAALAADARAVLHETYRAEAWIDWATSLLSPEI